VLGGDGSDGVLLLMLVLVVHRVVKLVRNVLSDGFRRCLVPTCTPRKHQAAVRCEDCNFTIHRSKPMMDIRYFNILLMHACKNQTTDSSIGSLRKNFVMCRMCRTDDEWVCDGGSCVVPVQHRYWYGN
jgi:hypothetical protein